MLIRDYEKKIFWKFIQMSLSNMRNAAVTCKCKTQEMYKFCTKIAKILWSTWGHFVRKQMRIHLNVSAVISK